jgi:uncharacterized protein GlcG (DUF336 family)
MDIHGNIVLKHRMNRAPAFAAKVSERKAYASALVGFEHRICFRWCNPARNCFR